MLEKKNRLSRDIEGREEANVPWPKDTALLLRGAGGSAARKRRWAGSGEKEKAFELRQQTEGFKENRLRVGAQTGVKVTFVFLLDRL